MRFLKEEFGVKPERFTISVNYHEGNGLSEEMIEDHWLGGLCLPRCCLRGHTIKKPNGKPAKRPYGVCRVRVNSTAICQHIYGAIEVYQKDWLE